MSLIGPKLPKLNDLRGPLLSPNLRTIPFLPPYIAPDLTLLAQ
jgi:hypothetical protein